MPYGHVNCEIYCYSGQLNVLFCFNFFLLTFSLQHFLMVFIFNVRHLTVNELKLIYTFCVYLHFYSARKFKQKWTSLICEQSV